MSGVVVCSYTWQCDGKESPPPIQAAGWSTIGEFFNLVIDASICGGKVGGSSSGTRAAGGVFDTTDDRAKACLGKLFGQAYTL
jgi:hypothetical protein